MAMPLYLGVHTFIRIAAPRQDAVAVAQAREQTSSLGLILP
jgi:hypothetical protein